MKDRLLNHHDVSSREPGHEVMLVICVQTDFREGVGIAHAQRHWQ